MPGGSRRRSPTKVQASVQEETASWLEDQAERSGRSLMKQSGRILDAFAGCHTHLRPLGQAVMEQLFGDHAELARVLEAGIRACAGQEPAAEPPRARGAQVK